MATSLFTTVLGSLVGLVFGFGIVALLLHSRVLPFDRRCRVQRGRFELPLSTGTCAAALPVTVPLDPPQAGALAAHALDRVGATDVVALDAWVLAGWQGITWRSLGQQVGVMVQPSRPGEVVLWCCSRPRLATTLMDWGASQRSAYRVAEEITQLMPAPVG